MAKTARLRAGLQDSNGPNQTAFATTNRTFFFFCFYSFLSGKAEEQIAHLPPQRPHTPTGRAHTRAHTYIQAQPRTHKYISIYIYINANRNLDIMVGVPGKYKGCETCRRRRVKVCSSPPLLIHHSRQQMRHHDEEKKRKREMESHTKERQHGVAN